MDGHPCLYNFPPVVNYYSFLQSFPLNHLSFLSFNSGMLGLGTLTATKHEVRSNQFGVLYIILCSLTMTKSIAREKDISRQILAAVIMQQFSL